MSETPPEDPGKERLLPGEGSSINGRDVKAIRHWLQVYRELYAFKERLLEEIREQGHTVTSPGEAELENDRKLVEVEAARVKRRIGFWEQQLKRQTEG